MVTHDILSNLKYAQLAKIRWTNWFYRFDIGWCHSRWYDKRDATTEFWNKSYYKCPMYMVSSDKKYQMIRNFKLRNRKHARRIQL